MAAERSSDERIETKTTPVVDIDDPRADLIGAVERSLPEAVHEFLGFHNADEAFFEYGAVPPMNQQRLIDTVFGVVEQTDWKVATVQTDHKNIVLHRE